MDKKKKGQIKIQCKKKAGLKKTSEQKIMKEHRKKMIKSKTLKMVKKLCDIQG